MGEYKSKPVVAELDNVYVNGEGDAPILRGVSLTVHEGERLLINGPSGSGKSTILRTLAGIVLPKSGEVRLFGKETPRMSPKQHDALVRGRVGVGFQRANLDEGRSVADNITSLQETTRHGRASASLMAELVVAFGLEDLLHRDAHSLSGGEKQRVALARLLLPRPELILLDEPTASLDSTQADGKGHAYDAIGWFAQESNATVVVVSHDLEAASFATRTVTAQGGLIPAAPSLPSTPIAA